MRWRALNFALYHLSSGFELPSRLLPTMQMAICARTSLNCAMHDGPLYDLRTFAFNAN